MYTKTFKLGEVCRGGIITIEIKDNSNFPNAKVISVICKDWDFSKGSNRSSDQSGAKELSKDTVLSTDENAYRKLHEILEDLTTSYHAGEIVKWIQTKVKFEKSFFW